METNKANFSLNRRAFITALLFEFCGSALITYAFNLSNQSPFIRAIAYAFGFIIAYKISGSHFNPATSLAVLITQKNVGQDLRYFITVVIIQNCGCLFGCLISYLAVKDFNTYQLYPKVSNEFFYGNNEYIFFGRVCLQEAL